jgi:hypothetical protein
MLVAARSLLAWPVLGLATALLGRLGLAPLGAGVTIIGTATIGDLMREVTTRYLP